LAVEQTDFLRHVVEVLERLDVPYMVVGSMASMVYGEFRNTQDIDIVAELTTDQIPAFLAGFPSNDYYLSESAVRDGVLHGVPFNLLYPATAQKVDFMKPRGDAWSRQQLARRRPMPLLPDRDVMTAAPEDVILGKLWYFSEGGGDRHLRDIAGILRNTGDGVDRAYVEHWAGELGHLDAWQQAIAVADGPDRPPRPGVP